MAELGQVSLLEEAQRLAAAAAQHELRRFHGGDTAATRHEIIERLEAIRKQLEAEGHHADVRGIGR